MSNHAMPGAMLSERTTTRVSNFRPVVFQRLFFALAVMPFYSIVSHVDFMSDKTPRIWSFGQEPPGVRALRHLLDLGRTTNRGINGKINLQLFWQVIAVKLVGRLAQWLARLVYIKTRFWGLFWTRTDSPGQIREL
jgi:hypothetical protein